MKIEQYIPLLQKQKILVLGDLMLDEFIWGKVNRISPEAPVPVVHVTHESAYPGGAANVARNLAEFGMQPIIGGMIADDAAGAKLKSILKKSNIGSQALLETAEKTIVKTRIIARQQQVVRVDRERKQYITSIEIDQLEKQITPLLPSLNAIIIEDYGKGFITQELVSRVIALAQQHNLIVTVDPNPGNPLNWTGATLVKPNWNEALIAAGMPIDEDNIGPLLVGEKLLKLWQIEQLLITRGEHGMTLFHPPFAPYHIPTRAREVYDVSGAGDTVIAFLTAALAAGIYDQEAAEIANHAAGVVVGKLGTATLTPQELIESFSNHE